MPPANVCRDTSVDATEVGGGSLLQALLSRRMCGCDGRAAVPATLSPRHDDDHVAPSGLRDAINERQVLWAKAGRWLLIYW